MNRNTLPLLIMLTAGSTAVLFVLLAAASPGVAHPLNRAGLVIHFDDQRTETHCIEFVEDTISGYELLQRSGHSVIASFESQGAAVCKIDDLGCPAEDCFCQSPPDYWSYWHLKEGGWVYSPQGSSGYTIEDGFVDGWAWGPGEEPPSIPFNQICADPTPTNTQTSTSSDTPTPRATGTPEPSPTFTSTSQAYPAPVNPTNTQSFQGDQPTSTQTNPALPEVSTMPTEINSSQLIATPRNPHIVFPAVKNTPTEGAIQATPTTNPAPSEPTPTAQYLVEVTAVEEGFPEKIPANYLVFGILAASLSGVVIFQSIKKRS